MPQVPVTLHGKTFNINCPEGEESHILKLADYVNEKISVVAPKCKAMSENTLLSFTLLAAASDVAELRNKVANLEKNSGYSMPSAVRSEKIEVSGDTSQDDLMHEKIRMAIQDIKNLADELSTH
ncbi:MAG: cell division protein ZapA [Pseudomonadota bacterium]